MGKYGWLADCEATLELIEIIKKIQPETDIEKIKNVGLSAKGNIKYSLQNGELITLPGYHLTTNQKIRFKAANFKKQISKNQIINFKNNLVDMLEKNKLYIQDEARKALAPIIIQTSYNNLHITMNNCCDNPNVTIKVELLNNNDVNIYAQKYEALDSEAIKEIIDLTIAKKIPLAKNELIKQSKKLSKRNIIKNLFNYALNEVQTSAKEKYEKASKIMLEITSDENANLNSQKQIAASLNLEINQYPFKNTIVLSEGYLDGTYFEEKWNVTEEEKIYTDKDISLENEEEVLKKITVFLKNKLFSGVCRQEILETAELPQLMTKTFAKYNSFLAKVPEWYIKEKNGKIYACYNFKLKKFRYESKYGWFDEEGIQIKRNSYPEIIQKHIDNPEYIKRLSFINYGPTNINLINQYNETTTIKIDIPETAEDWEEQLKTIFNDIKHKAKEKNQTIKTTTDSISGNLLYIAIIKTIETNCWTNTTAIISSLRGMYKAKYNYMKINEFTDQLNLIKKEEIETAINELAKQKIIDSKTRSGMYSRYTIYNLNSISQNIADKFTANKKEVLQKNGLLLDELLTNIEHKEADTITLQEYLDLINDERKNIELAINADRIAKVFEKSSDEIANLIKMKKQIEENELKVKIYNMILKKRAKYILSKQQPSSTAIA